MKSNQLKYTTFITIETDDSDYVLSSLVNKDGTYSMTSLEVPKKLFENNYWDNADYIINTLYLFLKKKYKKISQEDLVDLKKIPKSRRKELKGIIKQGIKMGLFKEEL